MASYLFTSSPQVPASRPTPSGPSAAMATTASLSPTIVMPQDWSVPSYLKYSVFYPRFTVSPSTLSPVASTSAAVTTGAAGRSSSGGRTGDVTGWGTATTLQSSSIDSLPTPSTSAVRLPSEATSAQERYQECLNNPNAKIPLPSKLDPKHCCKRLFIQDGVVQFCPEKDDQGRDSKSTVRPVLFRNSRSFSSLVLRTQSA